MHKDKQSCGEELFYDQEVGIPHDPLEVAVKKIIENEHKVVAHIPSNWSSTELKYYANYIQTRMSSYVHEIEINYNKFLMNKFWQN